MKLFLTRIVLALRRAKNWTVAQILFAILGMLRLLPAKGAIRVTERIARRIGPRTARHRLALRNLQRAFPEKSDTEREEIATQMWGHMARLLAEYVFVDELIDIDPENGNNSIIEVEGVERFSELRDDPRPFIVFTAHTGNFELLPIVAAKYGLEVTALFRPPNNPYIAKRLLAARRTHMGQLVPSRAGAAWHLAGVLEAGKGVGLLVDQKFGKGAKTKFFGLDVYTNPLLGKLARHFDCEVYPARSIRLPGGRFRLEIEPAVTLPRDENGALNVTATAQMLNDKVESWVRENPEQWQWFHDRWNIKHTLKTPDSARQ